eukprot:5516869-Alexandrium_andersonii.AAC.1
MFGRLSSPAAFGGTVPRRIYIIGSEMIRIARGLSTVSMAFPVLSSPYLVKITIGYRRAACSCPHRNGGQKRKHLREGER